LRFINAGFELTFKKDITEVVPCFSSEGCALDDQLNKQIFEMDTDDHKSKFSDWIRSPQTMIALSAVVLSVCGLFISIYETSLIREQQRASVWPNVQVTPSFKSDTLKIFVQNTGVGPARIMNASLTYKDNLIQNWDHLKSAFDYEEKDISDIQSLVSGEVVPPSTEKELIYRVASTATNQNRDLVYQMSTSISNMDIDLEVCYCSVYDECWTTRLSYVEKRFRGEQVPTRKERRVSSCSAFEQSGI